LGRNAIYEMMEAVRFIRDVFVPEFENATDPILGHSTISVGTITGGSKTHIVPDVCEATVDIRTVPCQKRDDFVAELTARLQEVVPGLEVSAGESAPLLTDPNHAVIGKLQQLGSKCVG